MKKPNRRIKIAGKLALLIMVILLNNSCQLRTKKAMITSKIQKTAKLATQEVTVSKYIKFDLKHNIVPFGRKSKKLIYVEAYIKYGVDLRKITPDDVVIKGDILELTLPPVEVLNFSIPLEKMREEYFNIEEKERKKRRRKEVERTDELLRAAQKDIEKTIESMNLDESARERTRLYMLNLLEQLGFGAVSIQFRDTKS